MCGRIDGRNTSLLWEQVGMVWYPVCKNVLQQQINTTVWTEIIMLLRPHRDWSVGLAERQHHWALAQNVCSTAVYKVQIQHMKDRLGVRTHSVWICGMYKSCTSESWGPPACIYKHVMSMFLNQKHWIPVACIGVSCVGRCSIGHNG